MRRYTDEKKVEILKEGEVRFFKDRKALTQKIEFRGREYLPASTFVFRRQSLV